MFSKTLNLRKHSRKLRKQPMTIYQSRLEVEILPNIPSYFVLAWPTNFMSWSILHLLTTLVTSNRREAWSGPRIILNTSSSCLLMFFKIGVPKNFENFTGKYLYLMELLINNIVKKNPLFYRTPLVASSKIIQVRIVHVSI